MEVCSSDSLRSENEQWLGIVFWRRVPVRLSHRTGLCSPELREEVAVMTLIPHKWDISNLEKNRGKINRLIPLCMYHKREGAAVNVR
uniref:Uncharacterized protein n=1 Tax=Anguilla anguilla TaxID=7936 RepID=A0A0E9WXW1_ANGAN